MGNNKGTRKMPGSILQPPAVASVSRCQMSIQMLIGSLFPRRDHKLRLPRAQKRIVKGSPSGKIPHKPGRYVLVFLKV